MGISTFFDNRHGPMTDEQRRWFGFVMRIGVEESQSIKMNL